MYLHLYTTVGILIFVYRRSEIDDEGRCLIGLGFVGALSIVLYDTLFTVWQVVQFSRPLLRHMRMMRWADADDVNENNKALLYVLRVNFLASGITFVAMFLNIFQYFKYPLLNGDHCLSSCTADVTITGIVIFWMTSHRGVASQQKTPTYTGESMSYEFSSKDTREAEMRELCISVGRSVTTRMKPTGASVSTRVGHAELSESIPESGGRDFHIEGVAGGHQ
jgi:hypothetical protein